MVNLKKKIEMKLEVQEKSQKEVFDETILYNTWWDGFVV